VRAWLEDQGRWLLVFDNVEDPGAVVSLLPRSGDGHVLLTSRRDVGWDRIATRVPLDVLEPSEAVEFLLARTNQSDASADQSDTATAGQLVEALGRLPLALEQAGGSIAEAGILTFAQYLDLFQQHSLELLNRGQGPHDYGHTIDSTWTVAVGQLREQAPAALDLLRLAAFLAPEELPSRLLTEYADSLPNALAVSARDPLTLVELVAAARRYSLVKATGGNLTLHRLLQAVIREGMDVADQAVWAGGAVRLLRAAFPDHGEDVDAWPMCRQLLPHALAAVERGEHLNVELDKVAWLLDRVARYATGRMQYLDARTYLERSLRIAESILGPQHPEVAIIRSDLGVVLSDLADYSGARMQLDQALPVVEAALGPDHPEAAIRRGVLGGVLRDLGDYAAAKNQFEQAVAIDEKAYGPNHPEVARDRFNLAGVLGDLGDYAAAKNQIEQALAIDEKAYGPNHPRVALGHSNLGRVLRDLGDYAAAKNQFEQALAIDEKAYGPNHPRIAKDRSNYALVLSELGDYAAARNQLEQALALNQETYGPNHPEEMAIRVNLGIVLRNRGALFPAVAQFEKALEIARASLGENHPKVAEIREKIRRVFPGSAPSEAHRTSTKRRKRRK
jgi:tetratricopeptide (TPR) repeat protein